MSVNEDGTIKSQEMTEELEENVKTISDLEEPDGDSGDVMDVIDDSPLDENSAGISGIVSDEDLEVKPDVSFISKMEESDILQTDLKNIANFIEDVLNPYITSSYKDNTDMLKSVAKLIFESLILARTYNVSLGTFPIGLEAVAKIIPMLSDEIQSRLDIYRPAGVKAAQRSLAEYLKHNAKENVIYINDMLATAYTFIGGNEEFVVLEINPRNVSGLSFRSGETDKLDKSIIPIQFKTPQTKVILRWNEIKQIISMPLIRLTDKGRHPEYREVEKVISNIVNQKKLIHVSEAKDSIAELILSVTLNSLTDAKKMAEGMEIDPESLSEVMTSLGYVFNKSTDRFEKQIEKQIVSEDILVARTSKKETPKNQKEMSSLLAFLNE